MQLLLALALAGSAAAQTIAPLVEQAAPAAPDIHPLLLGELEDPGSVVSEALQSHLDSMSYLTLRGAYNPESAASMLLDFQQGPPAGRAAAGVLARAFTDPVSRAKLEARLGPRFDRIQRLCRLLDAGRSVGPTMDLVVRRAKDDPHVARLFDGAAERPSLELDDVAARDDRLVHQGKLSPFLGRGELGAVSVHPKIDGAVVKMVSHSFEVQITGEFTQEQTAEQEEETSRLLAAAGVGPRYFSRAKVFVEPSRFWTAFRKALGLAPPMKRYRLASVRERVYGENVQSMMDERRFGPEEYRLIHEMLDRMADARVLISDMKPANIMIGRTKADPSRKAYFIDGDEPLPVSPAMTREELRHLLAHQYVRIRQRFNPYVGMVESGGVFETLLQQGLARSKETSRWKRFWQALWDAYAGAGPLGKP